MKNPPDVTRVGLVLFAIREGDLSAVRGLCASVEGETVRGAKRAYLPQLFACGGVFHKRKHVLVILDVTLGFENRGMGTENAPRLQFQLFS